MDLPEDMQKPQVKNPQDPSARFAYGFEVTHNTDGLAKPVVSNLTYKEEKIYSNSSSTWTEETPSFPVRLRLPRNDMQKVQKPLVVSTALTIAFEICKALDPELELWRAATGGTVRSVRLPGTKRWVDRE
jgi:hypothetical protein